MDFDIPISTDSRRIDLEGKILVAHQPECLPWLGFISKACMGDVYLIVDNVQFVKEHWHNRNKIRISRGEQWLVVPVEGKQKTQLFSDVKISYARNWKRKHLNSIQMSYSKSPYFSEIFEEIKQLYSKDHEYLLDYNISFIKYAFSKFNIRVPILRATDLIKQGKTLEGKKSDLIVNFCKATNTDTFVFGESGKTYIEKNKFTDSGIKFIFQDFHHPTYNQPQKGEFIPNMCFLDLLFNYGDNSKNILPISNFTEQ